MSADYRDERSGVFRLTPPEPKPAPRKHLCAATKCRREIAGSRLMCLEHWKMVSGPLQKRVWASYQIGQSRDLSLASREYREAVDDAVRYVANREGR